MAAIVIMDSQVEKMFDSCCCSLFVIKLCDESFSKIMLGSINQQYSFFHRVIFLTLICAFWNENNLKFLTALELLVFL